MLWVIYFFIYIFNSEKMNGTYLGIYVLKITCHEKKCRIG